MAFEFKLPEIGEGVAQGEIVKWLIKVGDAVTEDQPIVEIMTDKATVEIASPRTGTIGQIMAKEGDSVKVGAGLVQIDEGAGAKTSAEKPAEAKISAPASAQPQPKPAPVPQAASVSVPTSASAAQPTNARVLASPATRKLARENGINLSAIAGSGPAGRILLEDLQGQPAGAVRPTAPTQNIVQRNLVPSGGEERIPVRGIRKKIVENMARSKQKAAHFTHVDEVDMTELVGLRDSLKAEAEKYGVKLNYLPFIIKAICLGLKQHTRLNSTYDEPKEELVIKHYYNIGIAVATKDNDLIVPVIKNADQKTILELSMEISSLAEKARTNKLAPSDLQGGTFTLTSLGTFGGLMATPIINYPEVGIVGFHQIKDTPVVRDGQIVVRKIAHASISLDHRIVDGLLGATFLRTFINYLEKPATMHDFLNAI